MVLSFLNYNCIDLDNSSIPLQNKNPFSETLLDTPLTSQRLRDVSAARIATESFQQLPVKKTSEATFLKIIVTNTGRNRVTIT